MRGRTFADFDLCGDNSAASVPRAACHSDLNCARENGVLRKRIAVNVCADANNAANTADRIANGKSTVKRISRIYLQRPSHSNLEKVSGEKIRSSRCTDVLVNNTFAP